MDTKTKTALAEKMSKIKSADNAAKSGSSTPESGTGLTIAGAEKFVYMGDVEEVLELALLNEENVILWGPGGHAKSEYAEYFFKKKGIIPFVKSMGSGTTTDSLFGGMDIKQFDATGKMEYLVENSFMNHEYVVFEELLDAPDYIIEQLKDILTSKVFRNGTQIFPIKTKLIVCNTNRSRDDFAKNDSLKALMERFPLDLNVKWNAYNKETYGFLFDEMLGEQLPSLQYVMEKLALAGTIVSPRTAMKAAKIVKRSSYDYTKLRFFAEFNGKNKDMVQKELLKYKSVAEVEQLITETNKLMKQIADIDIKSVEDIKTVRKLLINVDETANKLKSKKVDDELTKKVNASISSFEAFIMEKGNQLKAIQI